MSHRALIESFYGVFATPAPTPDALTGIVAPGWTNTGSAGDVADARQFTTNVTLLHDMVPDVTWRVVDIIDAGDTVTVIGEGEGTPAAHLFGTPSNGASFTIASIDVHTIADGLIQRTRHIEDWATALRQVTA